MSTLVKEIKTIPTDRRITIEIPPEFPSGEIEITLAIPRGQREANRVGELYGTDKGAFWMADDFDAPMEEFKDYM
jgi:hypothetical protein